jgi:hypothetical protein
MNSKTVLAIRRAEIAYQENYADERLEYWRFNAIVELLCEISEKLERLDKPLMVIGSQSLPELRLVGSKLPQEPFQEPPNPKA